MLFLIVPLANLNLFDAANREVRSAGRWKERKKYLEPISVTISLAGRLRRDTERRWTRRDERLPEREMEIQEDPKVND